MIYTLSASSILFINRFLLLRLDSRQFVADRDTLIAITPKLAVSGCIGAHFQSSPMVQSPAIIDSDINITKRGRAPAPALLSSATGGRN